MVDFLATHTIIMGCEIQYGKGGRLEIRGVGCLREGGVVTW